MNVEEIIKIGRAYWPTANSTANEARMPAA